ncbi:MAG: MarR family transcriptional regulator [Proteobacteria bacterium]|nr:MarR family transcriptional regulator [Pseudomonadota bacterium]MBU1138062.1 MarR family transcriptional regulator [Pseudomonadota bacterium]MBU1232500.1 MarR family transcriptional regulator [Pseudomonadota bacterium]MBU1420253.1 MarR family transcriptional regulator [Pseudomonadota bacterium]MBU1455582.1 MarR family transcriptional regulator [Pseudomonadota bacterium]
MNRYRSDKKETRALSSFVKLIRAAETVSSKAHRKLREIGLTVSQFGVLEALYHLGPMCQKEIAEKILKSTGNITTVIDNLEKQGLVIRERNDADRRFFNIQLTDEGTHAIQTIFPDHAKRITLLMDKLTIAEQKELGRLCKKLSGA